MRTTRLALLSLALAGCGDSALPSQADMADMASRTDDGPAPPVDLSAPAPDLAGTQQACMDYVKAACETAQRCAPLLVTLDYGDVATCLQRLDLVCSTPPLKGSQLDPQYIEGCAAAYTAISCDDYFAGKAPAACIPPAGTLSVGASCGDGSQCATSFCAKTPGAGCGSCAAPPKSGDSCANLSSCGTGLSCTKGGVCLPLGVAGSTCDAATPCAFNLSCVITQGAASGVCTRAAELGQKCDGMAHAAPDCNTANGVFCNPITHVCQAFATAAAGATCGFGAGGVTVCAAGGSCAYGDGSTMGTCVGPAADGAQCTTAPSGPGCLVPAACTNGLCALADPSKC
jgi:hypothetical protein